jgi:hypothetical protein
MLRTTDPPDRPARAPCFLSPALGEKAGFMDLRAAAMPLRSPPVMRLESPARRSGPRAGPVPAVPIAPPTFAILLKRLPPVDDAPGLIALRVDGSRGLRPTTRLGNLTDAALRGRLAHHDAHSANEIAALRKALATEKGEFTLRESWAKREACLRFWFGFIGSKIHTVECVCEKCGAALRDRVGGTSGESFRLRCACGQVAHILAPK